MEVSLFSDDPDEPDTFFAVEQTSFSATYEQKFGDNDAYLGEVNYNLSASVGNGVILQVSANEGQNMSFYIDDMSVRALGVNESNVNASTQTGAMSSIGIIDEAIQKVSK